MKRYLLAMLFALQTNAADLGEIKRTLREVLPNTPVSEVTESEVPGLYRVISGSNVFYYNDEKRLMLFGEVMTTDGENLTSPHRQRAQQLTLEEMSESAFTIQNGKPLNVVYEFSNPDCGVCKHYEKYLENNPLENTVRHIFFLAWNEQGKRKLEHIMCSEDQEAAMHAVYSGADVTEFASCEQGKTQVQKHSAVAKALGVTGTPTLIVNGTRVTGFRPQALKTLLKSENSYDVNQRNESVPSVSSD